MKRFRNIIGIFTVLAFILSMGVVANADVQIVNQNRGGNSQQFTTGTQQVTPQSQSFQTASNPQTITVQTQVSVVPVYQFYSATMKDHFWTIDEKEKTALVNSFANSTGTYEYKGIAGYVYNTKVAGSSPVYRFWNKLTLDHFYTADATEKKQVEANFKNKTDNYEYEGIAFYAPTTATTSTKPVYRFFDLNAFNHYYTSDAGIYNSLVQMWNANTGTYRYEGISWYWY